LALVQGLISGTQKHFPSGSFTLGNVAYTTTTLVQALQGLASAITAVNAARVSLKDAVAALDKAEPSMAPLLRDYTKFLQSAFSTAAQQLADFGLQPPKARTPLTSEQLAARTAKSRATRAARGTTSKKQKLAIKGDVTGVQITPVTSPAPSSPSPQPATSIAPATPTAPVGTPATH
jgi:hypothetical protein